MCPAMYVSCHAGVVSLAIGARRGCDGRARTRAGVRVRCLGQTRGAQSGPGTAMERQSERLRAQGRSARVWVVSGRYKSALPSAPNE